MGLYSDNANRTSKRGKNSSQVTPGLKPLLLNLSKNEVYNQLASSCRGDFFICHKARSWLVNDYDPRPMLQYTNLFPTNVRLFAEPSYESYRNAFHMGTKRFILSVDICSQVAQAEAGAWTTCDLFGSPSSPQNLNLIVKII